MTGENEAVAIWGLIAGIAIGVMTGRLWLVIVGSILLVVCGLALISADPGGRSD